MQLFGGEEHLQGARLADQPRQPLCAAPSGDESEGSAAMAEDGVRPGDAMSAGQRQVESSTHAVSVNGGDGGSREVGHGLHQPLTHVREAKGFGAM